MRRASIAVLFAAVWSFAAPIPAEQRTVSVAAVKQRGVLVMLCLPGKGNVFVAPSRPVAGATGGVQDFHGVDVDLAAVIAQRLGVRLQIRPVTPAVYGQLISALLAGEGDIIASSFSITPERAGKVDFSQPYYSIWLEIVTRRDNPLASAAQLAGRSAAAIPGSSQEQRLKKLGVKSFIAVTTSAEAVTAVAAGRAELAAVDTGSAALQHLPNGVKIAFRLSEGDNYGIALPRSSDLLPLIDAVIEDLRMSGELGAIVRRHAASEL